jgi:hypothetical protein
MTVDLLEDLRGAVDQVIADDIVFEDFRDNLTAILQAKGWWGPAKRTDPLTGRAREVRSAATAASRLSTTPICAPRTRGWPMGISAGHKNLLPYPRYVDPDPNPRPQHLDWSGSVLRKDDPS